MNIHMDLLLKRYGQKVFEEAYGREEFMKEFHKNYLENEWKGDEDGI